MTFIRRKEDFTCEHCAEVVRGTGYTNHCPTCLWSKHVDIHPGDRAAACQGMMQPISLERSGALWVVTHLCERCNHKKRNKLSPEDDFDAALAAIEKASAR